MPNDASTYRNRSYPHYFKSLNKSVTVDLVIDDDIAAYRPDDTVVLDHETLFRQLQELMDRFIHFLEADYNGWADVMVTVLASESIRGTNEHRQREKEKILSRMDPILITASYSRSTFHNMMMDLPVNHGAFRILVRFELDEHTEIAAGLDANDFSIEGVSFEAI